jgi:VWFA-related protein
MKALTTAALITLLTVSGDADDQISFRSAVHSVSLNVSVRRNGRPVPSLGADDFEITDAGHRQTISDMSAERMPLDVTFVVDLSGSMNSPLLTALTAGVDAVRARLGDEDRAGLITFNHRVREVQPLGSPNRPFRESFGLPDGSTSLTDAITTALIVPPEASRRRLLVVFSDGRDTMSFTEGRALVEIARRRDSAIFVVALSDEPDVTLRRRDGLFGMLASATGGEVAVVRRHDEVGASFLRAVEDFRASYVLRYTYQGPAIHGWHPIAVKVVLPDRFEVLVREGYEVRP